MKAPVPFVVYIQAAGGKFLGPNAYNYAGIQVSLKYSLGIFPVSYKVVTGTDDGAISSTFENGRSSFLPILTMPESGQGNPEVNYLTPGTDTVSGRTNIFLPGTNETATLIAHIPTPSGKVIELHQPVLLNPQQTDYTVTMVVPGLLLTENTNTLIPPESISVFVAMMCGCKVTIGLKTSFWTYTDFEVSAWISYQDGTSDIIPLYFDKTTNQSLFIGKLNNTGKIRRVNFTARQKSTGNYGALLKSYL